MSPQIMKNMLFVAVAVLLYSCKIDHDKKVDRAKFSFKTGDDTELFFKNMRQSYYDLEENSVAKFNIFRYKDRVQEADHQLLNLAIVINYLQDEAYLLLEPDESLRDQDRLEVIWSGEAETGGTILLENYNREGMLEFVSQVYEALQKKARFTLKLEGEELPLLDDPREREAFRITVSDYYRLTRVY
ncbi:hypothetical protein LVD17_07950 [Fulvivirga ulvae]|uniref:hypothetical protein n=1 Tax=Fulvivirga ulvae TaxID=2904245 RepID=UPI001F392365|nr:hypothetical protein [Fulvivirga ulvae]UII33749.1 hypothetical protein LVD17_07950 [Fulvivirga ulvae]